jgi:hypothetical protein
MPLGSLVAGVLGSTIGLVPTLWIGFAGTVFGSVFVLFSPITRMKVLPSDEVAAVEDTHR